MVEGLGVRLVGGVSADLDGEPLPVPSGKAGAVLAALALDAGRVVTTERLVDTVWGEVPPASARALLHTYVSALRRGLGPAAAAVATVPGGYRLEVESDQVDVLRLLRLAPSDLDDAALTAALEDSADPVLPGLDTEPVRLARTRVTEARRAVEDELWRRRVAGGAAGEVLDALRAAVAAEPLDEERVLLLARALHATGRREEALAVLDRYRLRLGTELGLDPSARVGDLRQALVAPPPGPAPTAPRPAPASARPRRRPGPVAAVGLVLLVVALVVVGVVVLDPDDADDADDAGESALRAEGPSLLLLDRDGLAQRAVVTLPVPPTRLAVAGSTAWVSSTEGRAVAVVDLEDATARAVGLPQAPTALAASGGTATVGLGFSGEVVDVDTDGAGPPRPAVPAASGKVLLAADADGVWAASIGGEVQPPSGPPRRPRLDGAPRELAVDAGRAWVLTFGPTALAAVGDGPPVVSPLRGTPVDVAAGAGSTAWAVTAGDDRLWQAGPDGVVVTTRALPGRPVAVAAGEAGVWVALVDPPSLVAVDPDDLTTLTAVDLPRPPADLALTEAQVVVATR